MANPVGKYMNKPAKPYAYWSGELRSKTGQRTDIAASGVTQPASRGWA